MPTVKTYNSPMVQPRALPGVRQNIQADPDAFGAGIGRAMQQAGAQASSVYSDIKQKAESAEIKKAVHEMRGQIRQMNWEAEDAYFRRKGETAYKSYDDHKSKVESLEKEYGQRFTDPRVRGQFSMAARQYIDSELGTMARHASAERESYFDGQDKAIVEDGQKDGAVHYNDVDKYANQIRAANKNRAQRNGWSKEEHDAQNEKDITLLHLGAIDNILKHNPAYAKEYFNAHKSEMSGDSHAKVTEAINQRIDAQWAMDAAEKVRTMPGNRNDKLAAARELAGDNPDREKILMARVKEDMQQQKMATNEMRLEYFDEGMKGGSEWVVNNLDKFNALTYDQQRSILTGGTIKTDFDSYAEVRVAIEEGSHDKAMDLLNKYSGSISTADRKSLLEKILKPDTSNQSANAISDSSAFRTAFESVAGPKPSKDDEDDLKGWQRSYNRVYTQFQRGLDQWKQDNPGKKYIDIDSRNKILDQVFFEIVDTVWWDETYPSTEIDDAVFEELVSIPASERREIEESLNRRRIEVTPEKVVKTYNMWLNQQGQESEQ